jgi:hypothetical protein
MNVESNPSPSDQPPIPNGHRPLLGFVAVGLGLALTLFALLWPGRPSAHAIAPTLTGNTAALPSGCTRTLASTGVATPARATGCCPTPSGHVAPDACEIHGGSVKQLDQSAPQIKTPHTGVPHE